MAPSAVDEPPLGPERSRPPDWVKGQGWRRAGRAPWVGQLDRQAGCSATQWPSRSSASVIYEEEREKRDSWGGQLEDIALPIRGEEKAGAVEERVGGGRERDDGGRKEVDGRLRARPGGMMADVIVPSSSSCSSISFPRLVKNFTKRNFIFPFHPTPVFARHGTAGLPTPGSSRNTYLSITFSFCR